MNSHEIFIDIHQGCFAGTGAIVRLPQCQWSKPDGYGKISQCITTTKHSKAKTMCIFLGIYWTTPSADLGRRNSRSIDFQLSWLLIIITFIHQMISFKKSPTRRRISRGIMSINEVCFQSIKRHVRVSLVEIMVQYDLNLHNITTHHDNPFVLHGNRDPITRTTRLDNRVHQ